MEHSKIYNIILKSFISKYYENLGIVNFIELPDILNIKFEVTPYEGIHKDKKYYVTLKFQNINSWPFVFIDSEIYDKIKTNQYLNNQGREGDHKGICIKNMSYAYTFNKNFETYCGNKWENYIYMLIVLFNNLQDFEKGTGIKSNYKIILNLK
jgi:hypothetical protein